MFISRAHKTVVAIFFAVVVFQPSAALHTAQAKQPTSVPYTWKNVQIVGGGFVDGIIFHPTEKGIKEQCLSP